MSSDADRAALERFVAGLAVDPDVLARAITAHAVERTVVVEALLEGLTAPEPVVRLRFARRIARMPDLDRRVGARLTMVAGTDADDRVRAAATGTLRAHGLPVPGQPVADETGARTARPSRSIDTALRLRASAIRGTKGVEIEALFIEDAPALAGELHDLEGQAQLVLRGLPAAFVGTRMTLRVAFLPGSALSPIARADMSVSAEGESSIDVPLESGSVDDVVEWLLNDAELVVLAGD